MDDQEMIWDVPWTFNVPPKADDTDKDKPSTHKCVDKNIHSLDIG